MGSSGSGTTTQQTQTQSVGALEANQECVPGVIGQAEASASKHGTLTRTNRPRSISYVRTLHRRRTIHRKGNSSPMTFVHWRAGSHRLCHERIFELSAASAAVSRPQLSEPVHKPGVQVLYGHYDQRHHEQRQRHVCRRWADFSGSNFQSLAPVSPRARLRSSPISTIRMSLLNAA